MVVTTAFTPINYVNFSIDPTIDKEEYLKGRFMNHSKAEANLVPRKVIFGTKARIGFFAKETIPAGAELTWDYNDNRPEVLKNLPWLKK